MGSYLKKAKFMMSDQYEIIVAGKLPEQWSDWLNSVDVLYLREKDETLIHIAFIDQSALHGILNRIRDLGLHLVSVQRLCSANTRPNNDNSQGPYR